MSITIGDVEYVAKLAKLELEPSEKAEYTEKLNSILEYMQQLQELDTRDIEPTTHVLPLNNVFREDELKPCLPREKALQNAPDQVDGYFRVPRIL